jgi:hypothetical protein
VIGGKPYTLRGNVGVPSIEEARNPPATPLQFEILGDGKSLWKSEPIQKLDAYETFQVKLEKVKHLTLRVHCPGPNAFARSTWFEPILIEP